MSVGPILFPRQSTTNDVNPGRELVTRINQLELFIGLFTRVGTISQTFGKYWRLASIFICHDTARGELDGPGTSVLKVA